MQTMKRHSNRPMSLIVINIPAVLSLALCPFLLLLSGPIQASFWPQGMPNINDAVSKCSFLLCHGRSQDFIGGGGGEGRKTLCVHTHMISAKPDVPYDPSGALETLGVCFFKLSVLSNYSDTNGIFKNIFDRKLGGARMLPPPPPPGSATEYYLQGWSLLNAC